MDDNKKYPIKYDSEYYVVTANDLIRGQQRMSLRESQLLAIAIAQVVAEDKDLKTYTTTVPELAKFMGVEPTTLYRDLEGLCAALVGRVVKVRFPKGWRIFHFVSSAYFEDYVLTLRLSDEIKPFLIELERNYTQSMLGTLMSFRGYYTRRLYEYCKSEQGQFGKDEWTFSCDELRKLFQTTETDKKGKVIEERYKLNRDLLRNTIIPSLTELHSSDFVYVYDYVELRQRKPGQRGQASVSGVSFKMMFFKDAEEKERKVKSLFKTADIKGSGITPFGEEKKKEKKKKVAKTQPKNTNFEQTTFEGCEGMPEPPMND